jgi:hypothetical protein
MRAMGEDELLNERPLDVIIKQLRASNKEVNVDIVRDIVTETNLPVADVDALREKLSSFATAREYRRRTKKESVSNQKKRADSIKGHAAKLHRLLFEDPKFGLHFPSIPLLMDRFSLIQSLKELSIIADSVTEYAETENNLRTFFEIGGETAQALIGYDLAIIFEECFNRRAAASNPQKGEPGGPFVRFAKEVHRRVCSLTEEPELSGSTIRKALERMRPHVESWRKATTHSDLSSL